VSDAEPIAIADTIVVFTARPLDRIVAEAGSQAWELNRLRARQMQWLLCARNRNNPDHAYSSGVTEPHGSAFLLGKIVDVVPAEGHQGRYKVLISEYASVAVPEVWQHWRNPVRYMQLASLGIDPSRLNFEPVEAAATESAGNAWQVRETGSLMTIGEAKRRLSQTFGVPPEAIEITIRA
jgi:hypothetical protein